MTIPFRPVPPVASWAATHKEAKMVRHPKTLIDFMEMYPTEEDCRQALFEHRSPQGFSCRRCGHEKAWYLQGRGLYECAACHYQGSLTAGTVLSGTRTDLRKWFLAIWLLASTQKAPAAAELARQLGRGGRLLRRSQQPDREEPLAQVSARAGEHGARGQRALVVAGGALIEAAALQVPGLLVAAAATREPLRPAVLEERLAAVLLSGVHLHEVDQRLRMPHHLRLLVGRCPRGYRGDRTEGDGHVREFCMQSFLAHDSARRLPLDAPLSPESLAFVRAQRAQELTERQTIRT